LVSLLVIVLQLNQVHGSGLLVAQMIKTLSDFVQLEGSSPCSQKYTSAVSILLVYFIAMLFNYCTD